jgi:hypothetical protein
VQAIKVRMRVFPTARVLRRWPPRDVAAGAFSTNLEKHAARTVAGGERSQDTRERKTTKVPNQPPGFLSPGTLPGLLPARRAMRVDPVAILRNEQSQDITTPSRRRYR